VNLGRNDPCWCGSGTKYKRCHLDSDRDAARLLQEIGPEVREMMERIESVPRRLRDEYGVYINYVHPAHWQGRKVWAIGTRLCLDRPPNETFHEFILNVLRGTLGEEWRAAQAELPEEERHFVMRCFDEYARWSVAMQNEQTQADEGVWAAEPSGLVQSLISLAWDVATLIHASNLPDALVERLRDPQQFQGARYEIAIAAIFARLDCEIRFLDEDETLRGEKHVEFVATHRPSGQDIAVEAKSRHRAGVVNVEGERDEDDPLRGDARAVRRLFVNALAKSPDGKPYMVFIDINAPVEPEAEGLEKSWVQDIRRWMDGFPVPTEDEPSPYEALYVTNFSPHYDGDAPAQPWEWLAVRPLHSANPAAFELAGGMLDRALNNCHRVPEFGEDGELRD
jgi:hypothetical protein